MFLHALSEIPASQVAHTLVCTLFFFSAGWLVSLKGDARIFQNEFFFKFSETYTYFDNL